MIRISDIGKWFIDIGKYDELLIVDKLCTNIDTSIYWYRKFELPMLRNTE